MPREGTPGRESYECFTVFGVETIWPFSQHRKTVPIRGFYGAKRNGRQGCQRWVVMSVKRRKRGGRTIPTQPDGFPKRLGRRETFDSSVSRGATFRVHAVRKHVTMNPGAAEYGYSLKRVMGGRHRSNASLIVSPGTSQDASCEHDLAESSIKLHERNCPRY